ncbi:hypothetical protein BCF11_0126 [Collimonas sp. PA-H2]|uniref:hypothetical protein n=1 Tax=Collimonas sp. PA-H2 TaxID=1881062 RepID=UPI000BFA01A8|nr:hypothetical protein [Collimonas sp. PA-H2]PFH07788.1 hypothetical protein BCF11_0126 [Collimonas sp. PA-H2]
MKEFRQLIRRRFLYDDIGRARKILRLIAIIWLSVLLASLMAGVELWRDTGRRSAEFQFFVLGTLACVLIYWLCFARDELVLAGDVQIITGISEKHHKKLRRLARRQDTTLGDIIEQLMDVIVNARSQTLKSSNEATLNYESRLEQ